MGRRHNQDYFKVSGSETGGRDETGQSRARYTHEAARLKRGGPPTPVKPQGRTLKPGHRPGHEAEAAHERASRVARGDGKAAPAPRTTGRVEAPRGETSPRTRPGVQRAQIRQDPGQQHLAQGDVRKAERPPEAFLRDTELRPARLAPVARLSAQTPGSLRLLQAARDVLRGAGEDAVRVGRGVVRFAVGMAIAPVIVGRLVWRLRQV